jgi:hypothetical protein
VQLPPQRKCSGCGVLGHNLRTCERVRSDLGAAAGGPAAPAPAAGAGAAADANAGVGAGAAAPARQAAAPIPRASPAPRGRARAAAAVDDGTTHHFSLTIVNGHGKDVIPEHLDAIAAFLAELAPENAMWVAALERGAKEGHLHIQALAAARFSAPGTLTTRCKAFFATLGPDAAEYSVRPRDPAPQQRCCAALRVTLVRSRACLPPGAV